MLEINVQIASLLSTVGLHVLFTGLEQSAYSTYLGKGSLGENRLLMWDKCIHSFFSGVDLEHSIKH